MKPWVVGIKNRTRAEQHSFESRIEAIRFMQLCEKDGHSVAMTNGSVVVFADTKTIIGPVANAQREPGFPSSKNRQPS